MASMLGAEMTAPSMEADGSVEPQKFHTIVISTQHAEPLKATRTKECAGYTGAEMTAPSMEAMNKEIVEKVIKSTLSEIKLKSGKPALTLFGDHTHLHINPSGKFITGSPVCVVLLLRSPKSVAPQLAFKLKAAISAAVMVSLCVGMIHRTISAQLCVGFVAVSSAGAVRLP